MRIEAASRGPIAAAAPTPARSKKTGPLVRWRTDRRLKLVFLDLHPSVPFRSVPAVGMMISRARRRTLFLDRDAHLRALQGKSSSYRIRLFRRTYEATVAPRLGRKKRIIGTQGTMTLVLAPVPQDPVLRQLIRQRRTSSLTSALQSLELARSVAESARINCEVRSAEAMRKQRRAEEALIKAEAEGRRFHLLSDAGAVLDTSFDLPELLDRLGELLVHRIADLCLIHFREGDRLRRESLHHRDPADRDLLALAFPADEEVGFYNVVRQGNGELFPSVTPSDLGRIVPDGDRARALKEIGLQSLVRTPVRSHGRTVGMLTLGSTDSDRYYNPADLKMAESLAHRVALAHESVRLYEDAQREIALRKEAEARLRIFNVDLERRVAERTHLLEEAIRESNSFAYTVAHDLRAPLRAITGFCHALKEDYAARLDAAGLDYLDRVVHGARKMDDLIRDLLDYARVNRAEVNRVIVDLDVVLDDVADTMAGEIEDRRGLLQRASSLGRVVAHGPMMRQVVANLVSNALKFVAPGVRPEVRIWSEPREKKLRLVVEDNGIGIAPEHHERIFGIFERLNRTEDFPGTGIGLAIVRRAVERLGGRLGVESQPGRGSRFWIELSLP